MKNISSRQLIALLISGALVSTLTACSGGNGSGPSFAAATDGSPNGTNNQDPGKADDDTNDDGTTNTNTNTTPNTTSTTSTVSSGYQIGGVIKQNALLNYTVTLANGTDTLSVTNNSAAPKTIFAFNTKAAKNDPYAVTVTTQPIWGWCDINKGTGTAVADVTDIELNCDDATGKTTSAITGLSNPKGIAVNSQGDVFAVSDNNYLKKFDKDKVEDTSFTMIGVLGQNEGVWDVAVDLKDNVYLAMRDMNKIAKLTPDRSKPTGYSLNMDWATNPSGGPNFLNGPLKITTDSDGNVYVVNDWYINNKVGDYAIVKIPPTGASSQSDVVNYGNASIDFSNIVPHSIAVDSTTKNIFISSNDRKIYQLPQLGSATGLAQIVFGSGPFLPTNQSSSVEGQGLVFDQAGNLFIGHEKAIYVAKPDTIAGQFRLIGPVGNVTTDAKKLVIDPNNNVYALDFLGTASNSSAVYKITPVKK